MDEDFALSLTTTSSVYSTDPRPITKFALYKGDQQPGVFFEPYPDGTGFRFGQGTNKHVRVIAYVGEKQGLLPGRTYRISWLARWENVNALKSWHGFYFSASYGKRTKESKHIVEEPDGTPHSGTSPGWTRESVVMTIHDIPHFTSEFIFRFWGGTDGVAEVRDVALEEVEPDK